MLTGGLGLLAVDPRGVERGRFDAELDLSDAELDVSGVASGLLGVASGLLGVASGRPAVASGDDPTEGDTEGDDVGVVAGADDGTGATGGWGGGGRTGSRAIVSTRPSATTARAAPASANHHPRHAWAAGRNVGGSAGCS